METTSLAIYRLSDGKIVSTGTISATPDMKDAQLAVNLGIWGDDTHGIVEGDSDKSTNYVGMLGGKPVIMDRPSLIVSVDKTEIVAGMEFSVITGIPDPCQLIIDDTDPFTPTTIVDVDGGGFEFEADIPGVYTIEVKRFPFLNYKLEITAI